jgi:hypothetical protein
MATIVFSAALTSGPGSSGADPDVSTGPSTAASTDPAPPSDEPTAEPTAEPSDQRDEDPFPVTLEVPGWTCDLPADEKFTCRGDGTAVLVTVRPARSHDAYLNEPDKASPDQYVSDVHAGVFATINRMPDDHDTDLASLGAELQWTNEH